MSDKNELNKHQVTEEELASLKEGTDMQKKSFTLLNSYCQQ